MYQGETSADCRLTAEQLCRRASQMKIILTDCDGVLTDTGVYYSAAGEELKRFSIRDGLGVERLREAGIETAIVTGENCLSVSQRAKKLRLPHLHLGVKDKRRHLGMVLRECGVGLHEVAYIGDDVNDLAIIRAINEAGLTGAPADAMPAVQKEVHYWCGVRGGHGAFRDFAEWILHLRDSEDESEHLGKEA